MLKKLRADQSARLKKTGTIGAVILFFGVLYLLFVRFTGWGIPCVLRLVTGVYCPGCGITRMFVSLTRGDFPNAVRCNLLVMGLLPFLLFFGIRRWVLYVRNGEKGPDRAETVFLLSVFVLTVAFWILRNTEAFSWMRPISL